MVLNLRGDVCMWAYQPSAEPEILISSPADPASSPGEGGIHTHADNHNGTCRGDKHKKSNTAIISSQKLRFIFHWNCKVRSGGGWKKDENEEVSCTAVFRMATWGCLKSESIPVDRCVKIFTLFTALNKKWFLRLISPLMTGWYGGEFLKYSPV